MVLVTDRVKVKDWKAFREANDQLEKAAKEFGCISHRVYRREDQPDYVMAVEVWESHDAMHKFADAVGEEFNRRAGLTGEEWETEVWQETDARGF